MSSSWKSLFCVLLAGLMGAPSWGSPVQITWTGVVTAGFTTTFKCSSSCFPNCTYSWNFRGKTVMGSSLTWTPDGQDATVELQCSVHNPKTGISSTTSIVEIRNGMSVRISPQTTLPSLNQPLSLVCNGLASSDPQGPSDLVWNKDGQRVTLRENMQLLQKNSTLHFDSLLASDAGFYSCETYLPTLHTRVHSLGFLLSFDPWNVTISGPDVVFTGQLSEFTCLTSCTLDVECTVRWQFRGGFTIGTYFSVNKNHIKWVPSVPGTLQNFTCIAENKVAGRFAEDTKTVEVKDVPFSGSDAVKSSGLPVFIFYSFFIFRAIGFFTL